MIFWLKLCVKSLLSGFRVRHLSPSNGFTPVPGESFDGLVDDSISGVSSNVVDEFG